MLSHIDQSKKEEEVKQQEEDERLQGGGAEVDALQQAGLEDEVWGEKSPTSLLQPPPLPSTLPSALYRHNHLPAASLLQVNLGDEPNF